MVKGVDEESAVLAAILLDGALYQQAAKHIREVDFYKSEHRLIWRAMTRLNQEEAPIDVLSVKAKLESAKDLTRAGGSSYLSSMVDLLPDVANVETYAILVKKASASRDLAKIGKRLMDLDVDPGERIDIAFSSLADVSKTAIPTKEARVGDVASEIYSDILKGNGKTHGMLVGFAGLDNALDGINSDELIILGARPSVGKSAFSLQVAWNIAKSGKRVFYLSPEMSKAQLTMRLMSMDSGIPYMSIKNGSITQAELGKLKDTRDRIINLPLDIDDSPTQTIETARLQTRRKKASGGVDLLMVDYLQLLCAGDDSKEAVTVVSKGLKAIAKDMSIPVWAVTQLSRQIEYRDDKRPTLSDIRGSGQVEQDADVVMFIWQKTSTKTEVFIAKNRNGPLGETVLKFDKNTTRFTHEDGDW